MCAQVDTEQNVVLISIASVMDPSLAPAGKHTLHAYLPATEPYSYWRGLDRRSDQYEKLKEERSQVHLSSFSNPGRCCGHINVCTRSLIICGFYTAVDVAH